MSKPKSSRPKPRGKLTHAERKAEAGKARTVASDATKEKKSAVRKAAKEAQTEVNKAAKDGDLAREKLLEDVEPYDGKRRKGRFDVPTRNLILNYVASGLYQCNAAELAGIIPRTLMAWRARGRENLEAVQSFQDRLVRGAATEDEKVDVDLFGQFELDLMWAVAYMEATEFKKIQRAGQEDWKAAAWILERMNHKRYGSAATRIDIPDDMSLDRAKEAERIFLSKLDQIHERMFGEDEDERVH